MEAHLAFVFGALYPFLLIPFFFARLATSWFHLHVLGLASAIQYGGMMIFSIAWF